MEQPLLPDRKNYDPDLGKIRRTGFCGIIFVENQLLVLRFGFGEDDKSALIREVLEETVFHVVPASRRPANSPKAKKGMACSRCSVQGCASNQPGNILPEAAKALDAGAGDAQTRS